MKQGLTLFWSGVCLMAAGTAFASFEGSRPAPKCAGQITGALTGPLRLLCPGHCDSPIGVQDCELERGADFLGFYLFCKCPFENEPACCHVILRLDAAGRPKAPAVKGDCISCDLQGGCGLDFDAGSGQYRAACPSCT